MKIFRLTHKDATRILKSLQETTPVLDSAIAPGGAATASDVEAPNEPVIIVILD